MSNPEWVHYATLVDANSDKFYEVRVDPALGAWTLTKRWGRNPDTGKGQTKVETYSNRDQAINGARSAFNAKLDKGYAEQQWPHGTAAMPDFRNPEAVEAWLAT